MDNSTFSGSPSQIPEQVQRVPYVRVVMGESFAPRDLCGAKQEKNLHLRGSSRTNAFHLDVGHVPPVDCNTYIFQLLLQGCLRYARCCLPLAGACDPGCGRICHDMLLYPPDAPHLSRTLLQGFGQSHPYTRWSTLELLIPRSCRS